MARDADNALPAYITYSIARVRLACRVGKTVASCAGTAKEPEHHTAARVEGKLYLGESNKFSLATGFEGSVYLGMMFHFYLWVDFFLTLQLLPHRRKADNYKMQFFIYFLSGRSRK